MLGAVKCRDRGGSTGVRLSGGVCGVVLAARLKFGGGGWGGSLVFCG